MFSRRDKVHQVKVVANVEDVDAAVEKIESAIKRMHAARVELLKVIAEAKRAQNELENSMATAKRRSRGGW